MAPDRGDPLPTVPETPKDIFKFAGRLAQSGAYDPDLPGYGMRFYGRATVDGNPDTPVEISSHRSEMYGGQVVNIQGTDIGSGYEGKIFFFQILHRGDSYAPTSRRLPSSLGIMLSTVTRDEKAFEAHRRKSERERAEEERVDERRRRRGLSPRNF